MARHRAAGRCRAHSTTAAGQGSIAAHLATVAPASPTRVAVTLGRRRAVRGWDLAHALPVVAFPPEGRSILGDNARELLLLARECNIRHLDKEWSLGAAMSACFVWQTVAPWPAVVQCSHTNPVPPTYSGAPQARTCVNCSTTFSDPAALASGVTNQRTGQFLCAACYQKATTGGRARPPGAWPTS